jgi:hypothetical protein
LSNAQRWLAAGAPTRAPGEPYSQSLTTSTATGRPTQVSERARIPRAFPAPYHLRALPLF